jgi:hypothetical protein
MKAQTSIEFLTTYGWMLLAVATVSGIALSMNSGTCNTGMSGFPYGAVRVADFGLSEGGLKIGVVNEDPEGLDQTITEVRLENEEVNRTLTTTSLKTVEKGDLVAVKLPNVTASTDCNSFQTQISFERGGVVRSQSVSGVLRGRMKINGTHSEPYTGPFTNFRTGFSTFPDSLIVGDEFGVNYQVENIGNLAGTQQVDVNFTGEKESETFSLDPGRAEISSAEFTAPTEEGVYPIYVKSQNDTEVEYIEVSPVEPEVLTVDLTDYDGTSFDAEATVNLSYDGSVIDSRKVTDGGATFEKPPGNYTVNVSSDGYFDGGETVELDSEKTVGIQMHRIPEIDTFEVTDRSQCVRTVGWGFCADYDTIYDVEWNATDFNGHGIEANISYDGSEEFEGFSGSETIQRDDGYDQEHFITFRAGYGHYSLCGNVTDNAEGDDPSDYSEC